MTRRYPILLKREDWIEIDSALMSKVEGLRRGDYGPCDAIEEHTGKCGEECPETRRWIDHLEAIRAVIGEDGHKAATRGVSPSEG